MTWLDVLLWLLPAVLIFWSVGAYNRLVRLRAAVHQAYASLDVEFVRQAELAASALPVQDSVLEEGLTEAGALLDAPAVAWRSLRSAISQFDAVLAATRGRGLDAEAVAALNTARSVVDNAWARVLREGHDLAGAPMPEAVQARWAELSRTVNTTVEQFNSAVGAYNAAVRQFPAVLLGWLFGMRLASKL